MRKKTDSTEAMDLIKEQGVQYMRSLKINVRGKEPNQTFFVRPTINGKTLFVKFPTKEAAETFLSILPARTTALHKKTFLDYFMMAIDRIESENTKVTYYGLIKRFTSIAQKTLDRITTSEYENVFRKSRKSSWGQIQGIMKRVSALAGDDSFEKIRETNLYKYKYQSKNKVIQNPESIMASLLQIQLASIPHERARLAFLIMCYTGLRIGELGCLTPEDVKGNYLTVQKTVTSNFTFSKGSGKRATKSNVQQNTKGKVDRDIPLNEDSKELFREYFIILEKRKAHNRYLLPRSEFSRYLPEVARHAEVSDKITPHTARHIFGTLFGSKCKDIGEAMKLQKLLGHKNFETTQRYISIANPTADDISSKLPSLKKRKA